MGRKSKAAMVSFRLSFRATDRLLERIDFIAKNTTDDALGSRTAVITAAINHWLPDAESALEQHLKSVGAATFPKRK